jgi:hypothetical protein
VPIFREQTAVRAGELIGAMTCLNENRHPLCAACDSNIAAAPALNSLPLLTGTQPYEPMLLPARITLLRLRKANLHFAPWMG